MLAGLVLSSISASVAHSQGSASTAAPPAHDPDDEGASSAAPPRKLSAASAATLPASNPFAKPSTLPFQTPDFSAIKDSDYLPALLAGMAEPKPGTPFSGLPSRSPVRLLLACRAKAGAPGRSRTCDPRFRKPMLYPAELRARGKRNIISAADGQPAAPGAAR